MFIQRKDEKLIEKALAGSQSSWVTLVKRYEGLIYNYCLRMTYNSSDAMDLMQEVFIAIYRNLPAYRGQGQFKSWMMRIASNKTIDFLRASGRNPLFKAGEIDDDDFHSSNSPESEYMQFSTNKQIKSLLAQLSEEQRVVIELKFFQHLTFEEISQQTGVAISTLKTRLYTSLQKLKGQLEIKHVV
ncbi:RNA polymerase sigma factor [Aliikangiella maris]|uniref:Sigma-70 family RNA polymerase sigma factor n=2 Tax=Aliikangiella maris TaxID=3162458 RepID=A0ABV3MQS0_9GAMM